MLSFRPLGVIPGAASSIFVRRFAKPARPPREAVPSLQQLHKLADELFPGQMQSLEKECIQKISSASPRRALLQRLKSRRSESLVAQLTEPVDQYTPKMNSLFLRLFPANEPTTASQTGWFDDKYMRLGATKDNEATRYDPTLNDVEYSFHEVQALQLALLLNSLVGMADLDYRFPWTLMIFEDAGDDWITNKLFEDLSRFISDVFSFTCYRQSGMRIRMGRGGLNNGAGIPDLVLRVEVDDKFTECLAIFEFQRANAGLWIPWTLLNGQGWTDEERSAFFELQNIQVDKETQCDIRRSYEFDEFDEFDPGTWSAASEALDRIGTKGVEYKNDGYYINDDENITQLLQAARFKLCFNDFHSALSKVTNYATLSNCNRVVIADGLTVIAGSLHRLADTNSPKVLDAHFHSTAMIQTHQQESALYMMRYLCDAAMSSSIVRSIASQLLIYAKESYPDGEITEARQKNLQQQMQQHKFSFDREEHCPAIASLEQSIPFLTEKARGVVEKALCDLDAYGINMKANQTSSDAFTISEWFRRDLYDEMQRVDWTNGRCKSIAKVQRRGDTTGRYYVLQEYLGDEESAAEVKRQLESYFRVGKLAEDDKNELVEFGSLDLYTGIPRLYLLLEYVEGEEYDEDGYW